MGSVNKVILVGNLGRDAELRYTPGGAAVATLNLATTEVWNDRNNQRQEKTEWHRVVLWGKQAESLQEYLTKGKQIYVEGRLQTRQWDDKDGNKRYTTEIKADRITLLGGGGGGAGAAEAAMERGGAGRRWTSRRSAAAHRRRHSVLRAGRRRQVWVGLTDVRCRFTSCGRSGPRAGPRRRAPAWTPRSTSVSSIAVIRCTVFGLTWMTSPGFISRLVSTPSISISYSSFPEWTITVSSLTLWYCRLSAWPALMWRILPT